MLRNLNLQKFLSALFCSVYLFVALFSQNFHKHDAGVLFKDFHFKKTEKTFTADHSINNFSDCLSCHLVHDGNASLSEEIFIAFSAAVYFQNADFAYFDAVFSPPSFHFQKRGPPLNFS